MMVQDENIAGKTGKKRPDAAAEEQRKNEKFEVGYAGDTRAAAPGTNI